MPRRYTAREVVRVLRRLGWVVDRQHGSHLVLLKAGYRGHVTVPDHGSAVIIQKTFNSILKQAALTRQDFDTIAEEVL